MTTRITQRDLEATVARLNRLTDSPMDYAKPFVQGVPFCSNVGNYHIDSAYGGVQLVRVVNTGGGISNVLGFGHVTKRELYERMHAFIAGIESTKELNSFKPLPLLLLWQVPSLFTFGECNARLFG
jgi:hypothetical protein